MLERMLGSEAAAVAVTYPCYAGGARKVTCPPPYQETQLQEEQHVTCVTIL